MRDQDSVAVLQNIRDTYAHMAECHEDEPSGTLAAAWAEACEAGIAALQSQQDGAQGGEAVECDGWRRDVLALLDELSIDRTVLLKFSGAAIARIDRLRREAREIASRPAIAPQATPAAVDDAKLGAAFRRLSTRNYGNCAASLFIAQVLEQAALAAPPAEVKP